MSRKLSMLTCALLGGTALVGGQQPAGALPMATGTCTAGTALARMTLDQQVGQMFMVGTPATSANASTLATISTYHVGNAFLSGRASGTAAPAAVTAALRARVTAASTHSVPLLVATDQEGGYVQVLQGSGFSAMPTALTQGRWAPATLQASATTWGKQLRNVGVNMNLTPVADTVPPTNPTANPPIGYYQREYSYYSGNVSASSGAVIQGMRAAGVGTSAKHFPGLGLVRANTDTTANVHDTQLTTASAYLNPFRNAVNIGVPAVMMSSAIYDKIDKTQLAVFSPAIIKYLRGTMKFNGVVITDDIGAAAAPSVYSPAFRAIKAVVSGDNILLTVTPTVLPQMYNAVLSRARTDAGFRALVTASAGKVLTMKANQGLLPAAACS